MISRASRSRLLLSVGFIALLLGILDPLEGALVLLAGAAMVAFAALIGHSRYRIFLSWAFGVMAIGVAALFALSAMGGLGGVTNRPIWWAIVIAPYPIGWIMAVAGAVLAFRETRDNPPPAVPQL